MIHLLTFKFKSILTLVILNVFLFIQNSIAQNPASADSSLGLGGFIGDVRVIKVQTDGKVLVGGNMIKYKDKDVKRLVRLNPDGSIDNSFNIGSGADTTVYCLAIQSDGKIIVGGVFASFNGLSKKYLLRLNSDGSIDNTFNIGTGPQYRINALCIQPDGKILVGGFFSSFNGDTYKRYLVRLNTDGSLDYSFTASGYGAIYSIVFQNDGKILAGGLFSSFNGTAKNTIVRLNIDGTIDNTFDVGTGAISPVESMVLQVDGKLIIGGAFSTFNNSSLRYLIRLNSNGTIDNTFTPDPNGRVCSVLIQSDGKLLVGGEFSYANGLTRNGFMRLNADGSDDTAFNINTATSIKSIYAIALHSDEKIWAGGYFSAFNDIAQNHLTKLNSDGTFDNTFITSQGFYGDASVITLQSNGKILAGGSFRNYNGEISNRIVRINKDGSYDNSFNIGTGASSLVRSLAVQDDGKIYVGGEYTTFNGISKNRIVRLNVDGSLDNSFSLNGTGPNGSILAIAIQPDGKVLLGGGFTSFNGIPKGYFVRLNPDGSLDNTFTTSGANSGGVWSIKIQTDGKILVGGGFSTFDGTPREAIVRLNADGTIDSTFQHSGNTGNTRRIVLQPDNKIIVGGNFTSWNSSPVNRIVRLNPDGSLDKTFNSNVVLNTGISDLALQSNGRIVVGGQFTTQKYIFRLNPDGSIDNTFNIGESFNSYVYGLAVESDGSIVAVGNFSAYNGIIYNKIIRLLGDPVYQNTIKGKIYVEENKDCIYQVEETPLPSVIVEANPGSYFGSSDAFGNYYIRVDSGAVNYTISQRLNTINSELLFSECTSSHNVSLSGSAMDTCCFNFADSIKCNLLNISIQNTRMRRCFKNNTFLNYCNYGKQQSVGTEIKVIYPSHVVPLSSMPMWSSKQGSELVYDIGTVAAGHCGEIVITDSVLCGNESIRGLTQCIQATISPVYPCIPESASWDHSSIDVTGECNNGIAHFTISNLGNGSMSGIREYRVFQNDTLIYANDYQINSGQSFMVEYPAQGQTIRLEADQHPEYPGKSRPRAIIEDCGISTSGINSRGLVTTSPQNDLDEETAITCNEIIDSYDPNDKQAIPIGIGTTRQILPGSEIEYIIRFQNTGTDTAYTVRIVDTLDSDLDPASFTLGSSSHSYALQVTGKGKAVVTFNFYNINLPDSTTNKIGSQGLISFRITVPSGTFIGTEIKNKAYIYFDYNSPIITNETIHTVGNTVVSDFSKGSLVQTIGTVTSTNSGFSQEVKIYPNPASGFITVEIPGAQRIEMRILSLLGKICKSITLDNPSYQEVNLEDLGPGVYVYELWQNEEWKAGGLLNIK